MAIHNHDTGVLTPPQAFSKNMDCWQSAPQKRHVAWCHVPWSCCWRVFCPRQQKWIRCLPGNTMR